MSKCPCQQGIETGSMRAPRPSFVGTALTEVTVFPGVTGVDGEACL